MGLILKLEGFVLGLEKIADAVEMGNVKETTQIVKEALDGGSSVQTVLDSLIAAMANVGELFKQNEIFVPEMILSARAMTAGLQLLEPLMLKADIKPVGTVVIGTIKGDLHEIGKNLVAMMLRGIGATVYDLGIDVSPEAFLAKAQEVNADIVAISSLLTTTMAAMPDVIELFEKNGLRDKVFFMVGGAPISQRYAKEIGADGYAPDASTAAELALAHLQAKYSA
jgi:5-methyltetrahydrofolate--homocysteine methyltransferase